MKVKRLLDQHLKPELKRDIMSSVMLTIRNKGLTANDFECCVQSTPKILKLVDYSYLETRMLSILSSLILSMLDT